MSPEAFEFLDAGCMQLSERHLGSRRPIASDSGFYVLLETHGSNREHDQAKLDTLLEHLMSADLIQDGTIAADAKQVCPSSDTVVGMDWDCSRGGHDVRDGHQRNIFGLSLLLHPFHKFVTLPFSVHRNDAVCTTCLFRPLTCGTCGSRWDWQ